MSEFKEEILNIIKEDIHSSLRFTKIKQLIIDYQQSQLKGFKYCPHCGDKLEHKISTDENTDKVCKSELCKKQRHER